MPQNSTKPTTLQKKAEIFDPEYCRKWVRRLARLWGPQARTKRAWFQEGMLASEHGPRHELNVPGVCGPLELVSDGNRINLGKLGRSYWQLPGYVGSDQLAFKRCWARGVLVVKEWWTARHLAEVNFQKRAQMVVLCTDTMPRLNSREFLHRLTNELKIPVYLLTPNTLWGYFTFSVLRRGSILSHVQRAKTRIAEVRYLGIRAGDCQFLRDRDPNMCVMKSYPEDRIRLQCMRKYRCFQSAAWKKEFDRFEAQRGFVDLEMFTNLKGPEWLADFVQTRIEKRDWLS